jgi:histidine triad (HIT) family protein
MKVCIFCSIADGTAGVEPVYEDEHCVGFHDIHPQAPTHILVVPRFHLKSLNEIGSAPDGLFQHLLAAVQKIAAELKLAESGYRVVINTGPDGGQAVFHLHLHLLAGRAMQWPPG